MRGSIVLWKGIHPTSTDVWVPGLCISDTPCPLLLRLTLTCPVGNLTSSKTPCVEGPSLCSHGIPCEL